MEPNDSWFHEFKLARHILSMLLIGFGFASTLIPSPATTGRAPETYYVNANSGNDSKDGLSPATAWRTIGRANGVVQPGDTVLIYSGRYHEGINPGASGSAGMRISYRAAAGEQVIVEGAERLLDLRGKSYITVEGMTFRDPLFCWGEIEAGHHNEVLGNRFIGNGKGARTAFSGLYLHDGSAYNRIVGNRFEDWGEARVDLQWGDAVRLSNAPYNLIEGNQFRNAGHSLLGIESSYNLIRGNVFENEWQKGVDLVWRVRPWWAPDEEFPARRNVFEYNLFVGCRMALDGEKGGTGIQIAAAETIFRRNVLIENERSGISLNGWEPDATKSFGNRIYHNTFVDNGFPGVFVTNWGYTNLDITNNIFKNNIFYQNNLQGDGVQMKFDLFPENAYSAGFFRDSYMITGSCISSAPTLDIFSLAGERLLRYYQQNYPDFVKANHDADPQFVDPLTGDFRLTGNCECIDAGVPLTSTREGGSGNILPVMDASYFSDGYGLMPGDQVKVGSQPPIEVLRVDYTNDTLTLAQAITWEAGDPVYWGDFQGPAPDAGAFEDIDWRFSLPASQAVDTVTMLSPQPGLKKDSE